MEAKLFVQTNMHQPEVHALAGGHAVVFSARSPAKETSNEDSVALVGVNGSAAVLVVADGMGGMPAGERASALAIKKLIKQLQDVPPEEPNLRAAILDGMEAANRAIADLGVGAATTMTVAEIRGRTVRPYHVGDSMIVVVGQRGKIKLQTVSHSPVGYAVEAGLLDESEAMHHEDRHLVSNMLGSPDMRIDIGSTIELADRDTLILASDGLFDNLHIEEIVRHIRKGPLGKVATTLVDWCRRRMEGTEAEQPCKPDDLSFIAFRMNPPRRRRPAGNA